MMSSLRQQIAVQKMSEYIRNSKSGKGINKGKILREAGYSMQTSLKPKIVTQTKGFIKELSRVMPNKTIVKTHGELLEAVKLNKMSFNNNLSDLQIKKIVEWAMGYKVREIIRSGRNNQAICYYWSPDGMTRLKALDMGYKIRGLYSSNKHPNNNVPIVLNTINCNK